MKIIKLTAENIKRLVAVSITPDGNLVEITGRNGAGKTSILDSILWALTGARNIQMVPIRRGASQGRIKLDMGEIIVTRTFQREKDGEGFTTKLEVVGDTKGTPQQMLNGLLDSLAFDPLEFARMDIPKAINVLKSYVPDFDFKKCAAENSIDFSARAEVNRKAKELRIQADQIIVTDKTPTEIIDETALVTALAEAGKKNTEMQLRAANRAQMQSDITTWRNRAAELKAQAEDLMRQAGIKETAAFSAESKLTAAPPLPELVNVADIQSAIGQARIVNLQVDQRDRKSQLEQQAITAESESKQLTSRMDIREQQKRVAITAAKLPVNGLSFSDDMILMNGIPFDQASDAERLRVSCAIAMAGNPQLRVIRVRDGSLLDEESLALVARMAEEKDYQVWIERVGEGKTGFIIEDGMVKERAQ